MAYSYCAAEIEMIIQDTRKKKDWRREGEIYLNFQNEAKCIPTRMKDPLEHHDPVDAATVVGSKHEEVPEGWKDEILNHSAEERDGVVKESLDERDGITNQVAEDRVGVVNQFAEVRDEFVNQSDKERDGVINQSAEERDGVVNQSAEDSDEAMAQNSANRDEVANQSKEERDGVLNQSAEERDEIINQPSEERGEIIKDSAEEKDRVENQSVEETDGVSNHSSERADGIVEQFSNDRDGFVTQVTEESDYISRGHSDASTEKLVKENSEDCSSISESFISIQVRCTRAFADDGELFRWGLYGKPEYPDSFDEESDTATNDNERDVSGQPLTGDLSEVSDPCVSEVNVGEENGFEDFDDVREIRPYLSSIVNFTGEYEGQEEVMKDMGLPLSFVRSPRDCEEEEEGTFKLRTKPNKGKKSKRKGKNHRNKHKSRDHQEVTSSYIQNLDENGPNCNSHGTQVVNGDLGDDASRIPEGFSEAHGLSGHGDGSEDISTWEEYWEKFGHGLVWQGWLELHPEFGEAESSCSNHEGCPDAQNEKDPDGVLMKISREGEDDVLIKNKECQDVLDECLHKHVTDSDVCLLLAPCQNEDIPTQADDVSEEKVHPYSDFRSSEVDNTLAGIRPGQVISGGVVDSDDIVPQKSCITLGETDGTVLFHPLPQSNGTSATSENEEIQQSCQRNAVKETDLNGDEIVDSSQDAALTEAHSKWTPALIEEWDKHSSETYWYYHHWFHSWQEVLQGEGEVVQEIPRDDVNEVSSCTQAEEHVLPARACDLKGNVVGEGIPEENQISVAQANGSIVGSNGTKGQDCDTRVSQGNDIEADGMFDCDPAETSITSDLPMPSDKDCTVSESNVDGSNNKQSHDESRVSSSFGEGEKEVIMKEVDPTLNLASESVSCSTNGLSDVVGVNPIQTSPNYQVDMAVRTIERRSIETAAESTSQDIASTVLQEQSSGTSPSVDILDKHRLVAEERQAFEVDSKTDQHEAKPSHNLHVDQENKIVFQNEEDSGVMREMGLPSSFGKDVPQGREVSQGSRSIKLGD
ncbi:uncharacterized protein LOC129280260 [Lytechinus pictus]|uniref:uncharacterized protein LOC129280260 n=1 Tax=Lytechinus pictus TaxID=7653 RepID=UPI0030B9B2F9